MVLVGTGRADRGLTAGGRDVRRAKQNQVPRRNRPNLNLKLANSTGPIKQPNVKKMGSSTESEDLSVVVLWDCVLNNFAGQGAFEFEHDWFPFRLIAVLSDSVGGPCDATKLASGDTMNVIVAYESHFMLDFS